MSRTSTRRVALLMCVLAVGLVAPACQDDDGAAVGSATTTTIAGGAGSAADVAAGVASTTSMPVDAADAADAVATPVSGAADMTTTTAGVPSRLEGSWRASITELLGAGGAGEGGLNCSGSVTYSFHAGVTSTTGGGSCAMGPMNGTITYDARANYRVEGDRLIITNTSDGSRLMLGGTAVPGVGSIFGNGTLLFSINGDELTVSRTDPDLGTLAQTLHRV